MDKYNFGNKLCFLREEKGLTQKELAKILEVSDKAISKWENGQSLPRMDTLEKIADVLGTSIEALISDDNTEIERHRVKRDIYINKSNSEKGVFYSLGIGSIVLVLIVCIFDAVVYFLFNKSNLYNLIEQNLMLLLFPLGMLAVYAFIKTIIFGFVKGFLSIFNTSPNCIEAENKTKYFRSAVHNVSALLTFFFFVIALISYDTEMSVIDHIVIYVLLIALLSVYFLTIKYSNIDLYFTENGMFEESIDYGAFHPYSSFEDIKTNANDVSNGISNNLKISFIIDGLKYKTVISDSDIPKILQYLKINVNVNKKKQPDNKFRVLKNIFYIVGLVITAIGIILFVSNMQFGTLDVDYTLPKNEIVSIDGNTKVIEYNNKVFAFTEQNCAVDVFDTNGNFLYANQVPIDQNGISDMYLINNNLYIFDRNSSLYRYDINGSFLGKCTCDSSEEGIYTVMIYNSKDELVDTKIFYEENMLIAYFDDNKYVFTSYADYETNYVLTLLNGVEKKITAPASDCVVDYVDDAVYSSNDYYTFRGSIYSNTNGKFYEASIVEWYMNSILCSWLTAAAGILFAFLSTEILKAIEKRK